MTITRKELDLFYLESQLLHECQHSLKQFADSIPSQDERIWQTFHLHFLHMYSMQQRPWQARRASAEKLASQLQAETNPKTTKTLVQSFRVSLSTPEHIQSCKELKKTIDHFTVQLQLRYQTSAAQHDIAFQMWKDRAYAYIASLPDAYAPEEEPDPCLTTLLNLFPNIAPRAESPPLPPPDSPPPEESTQ